MDESLQHEWRHSAAREPIGGALRALYADIDEATNKRRPRCDRSGRCCHFEQFGHRLYITGLETSWFLNQIAARDSASERFTEPGLCPFLAEGLCSVHDIRPMGCRIFFCDPGAQEWQSDLYERAHEHIAALHEEHGIAYRYGEWREMLRSCGGSQLKWNDSAPSSPQREFVHVRIAR